MTQNVNVAIANREAERANRVRERETQRHNTAVERETNRSNLANEWYRIQALNEQRRHSVATEYQASRDLAERHRAATASESLRGRELGEAFRHNISAEGLTRMANTLTYQARMRELAETQRSHRAGEQLTAQQNSTRLLDVTGNLGLREQELNQKLLLENRSLDLREKDIVWQHSDRLGNLEVGSYKAKTDRLGTILSNLTSLLQSDKSKR